MAEDDGGFLSRWSKRKARSGAAPQASQQPTASQQPPASPPPAPPAGEPEPAPAVTAPTPLPPPTLDDVAALTCASDYSRFVAPGVDAGVSNAAMKKLFSDPHFNVMDRLDIYIDDYSQPDPIPPAMLRQMVQSKFLGLFDAEEDAEKQAAITPEAIAPSDATLPSAPDNQVHDDDADLQLQPDDAAGRAGAGEGAGPGQV